MISFNVRKKTNLEINNKQWVSPWHIICTRTYDLYEYHSSVNERYHFLDEKCRLEIFIGFNQVGRLYPSCPSLEAAMIYMRWNCNASFKMIPNGLYFLLSHLFWYFSVRTRCRRSDWFIISTRVYNRTSLWTHNGITLNCKLSICGKHI